jgi:hypothetical protein
MTDTIVQGKFSDTLVFDGRGVKLYVATTTCGCSFGSACRCHNPPPRVKIVPDGNLLWTPQAAIEVAAAICKAAVEALKT